MPSEMQMPPNAMSAARKILVVHYSQTGQLSRLLHNFIVPLQNQDGIEVHAVNIEPREAFPFPWPFWRFFDTFPETVHLKPQPVHIPDIPDKDYDAVVIGYTVWFLSPAQPITAFLQQPQTRALLNGKPVITIIGCRNMWLTAQEKIKILLAANGARLIGNIVKTDACGTAASFLTTPAWLLTGERQYFKNLPAAGISEAESADMSRFGQKLAEKLQSGSAPDETLFRNMGAAVVDEKLILSEKAGARSFFLWGRLLMAAGNISPLLRRILLAAYIVFLIVLIVAVVPLSAWVKMLLRPVLRPWLARQKQYYSQPSGE